MRSLLVRLAVLGAGAVAAVVIAVLVLTPGTGSHSVQASFTDAEGLFDGSPVMVAGVTVGSVTDIRVGPDGLPLIRMQISNRFQLHATARADIRLLSNSGELNRVIELSAGQGAILPAGATIPASRTASPVEIDQALDILSPATRANVRQVLASFDDASHGLAGAYRASLAHSATALGEATAVLRDVTQDGTSLRTLVDSGDVAMGAFARNRAALGDTVDELSGLLTDTAQHAASLRAAITALPEGLRGPRQVLDNLAAATPTLRRLLTVLQPALNALAGTSQVAVPAFNAAKPLLRNLTVTLRAAPPQLRSLRALLASTQPFATQLGDASQLLAPVLDETRAYTPEADGFLEDWSDVGSSFDAVGHAMRLFPSQAMIPNTIVPADSQAAGYLASPYVRPPGALVGQPWEAYSVQALSKRWKS